MNITPRHGFNQSKKDFSDYPLMAPVSSSEVHQRLQNQKGLAAKLGRIAARVLPGVRSTQEHYAWRDIVAERQKQSAEPAEPSAVNTVQAAFEPRRVSSAHLLGRQQQADRGVPAEGLRPQLGPRQPHVIGTGTADRSSGYPTVEQPEAILHGGPDAWRAANRPDRPMVEPEHPDPRQY